MTRLAVKGRVHFWEEPRFEEGASPYLAKSSGGRGVHVLTPVLPHGLKEQEIVIAQRRLLDRYLVQAQVGKFVAWYYTSMALPFSAHLSPEAVVYDCMDELSAFQGASARLVDRERSLFAKADVVFAGGASLYAAKKSHHRNVHLFPSSIDHDHFAAARRVQDDPIDQALIAHPRIGFYGVLDERLDGELLRDAAAARPEWHFVLLGPVVKIRKEDLPRAGNIHYLGQKRYEELPLYLAHWDVAMLPFARNASTRFISPTKTPEYLAGGKPVVSTPIHDVVEPYGAMGLVRIGASVQEFIAAIEQSLVPQAAGWREKVDDFLEGNSWDMTFEAMWKEIRRVTPLGPVRSARTTEQSEKGGEACLTI